MDSEYEEIRDSLTESRDARIAVLAALHADHAGSEAAVKVHTDRGEQFDSIRKAGREVGITHTTIVWAMRRGRRCAGRMWAKIGTPIPNPPSVIVSDRGESWEDARSCAAALGVNYWTLRRRLRAREPVAGRRLAKGPQWEVYRRRSPTAAVPVQPMTPGEATARLVAAARAIIDAADTGMADPRAVAQRTLKACFEVTSRTPKRSGKARAA